MDDPTTYDEAVAALKDVSRRLREQSGLIAELRERLVAHQGDLAKKQAQLEMAWHKQDAVQNELGRLKAADERCARLTMQLEEALVRIAKLEGRG